MPKRKLSSNIPEKIPIDASGENTYDWKAPTMMKVIESLASKGYDNKEIAQLLGVRSQTLNRHLRQAPKLEEKLVHGRSEATQIMVATVFESAVGGRITQKKHTKIDKHGNVSFVLIEEELLPDVQAQMFWLTNQDPENWKNYRDIIKINKDPLRNDQTVLESDKITRLSRGVVEGDTDGTEIQYPVSTPAAYPTIERSFDAADVPGDVPGETADHLQDNVLDLPAETRTEPS